MVVGSGLTVILILGRTNLNSIILKLCFNFEFSQERVDLWNIILSTSNELRLYFSQMIHQHVSQSFFGFETNSSFEEIFFYNSFVFLLFFCNYVCNSQSLNCFGFENKSIPNYLFNIILLLKIFMGSLINEVIIL